MKDNETALSFFKDHIREERIPMTSATGSSYELLVIEIPDDEGDEHEIKRTFVLPATSVHIDNNDDRIRYAYLKKDGQYRIMRSKYDKESRSARVEETYRMTGQEIADAFKRNGKRKEPEDALTPDSRKERTE